MEEEDFTTTGEFYASMMSSERDSSHGLLSVIMIQEYSARPNSSWLAGEVIK